MLSLPVTVTRDEALNSDEEKTLFERYGWRYDFVNRHWISPTDSAIVISTDTLVENAGAAFDHELRMVIMKYGELPEEDRL